jgi:signal transduction histidine kinase
LENLNDWSSIFRERVRPHPEYFQLFELINEKLMLFRFIIEIKDLNVEMDKTIDPFVNTDKHMLGSVIRNLLSNAVKYTLKGGNITISAVDHKNEVVIQVKDSGIGMSQEDVEFYMNLDSNMQDIPLYKNKSAGLGLVLSKNFIERIHGKIFIESIPDKGTTVYLSIPKV